MNKFSFEIKDKFGENYCRKNFIAPAREEDDCFVFYSLHNDELLKYNLEQKLQKKVLFEIKSEEKVIDEIDKIYRDEEKYNILRDINLRYKDDITLKENEKEDSPAVRVLDYIIRQSIIRNASDIHIEPRFQDIVVRIRIDGALNELMRLPKNIYPHLVTRIKILSKLDISEKRLPQDGRFSFKFKNEDIDIRVATTPTGTGEKIVLRILDVQRISYTPEGIGLSGENLDKVMNLISQPSGLILCCGPTSSGKTTIFNLISKLYTDYEGEILINDIEISDIKDEDLRDEVLFIESKPFILCENLNSNITLFGKNEIDELFLDKIIRFLELEKIKTHKTKNLEDTLSKGEQQKVQLTRMMIGQHSLILLDEVLSGFDQEMKKKAISKIKEKSKNSILIIISHDYEIQKTCDDIFLMADKKENY
ncbi:ATPase, T2SS/T4P/T4SS family [Peptoniphilus rhinitidis]|uniref:ATPase, T2SS/T4P/T4SS family n=1 Tax=Peptoniphilus rhinitidis TaxID=1175452 RepID=UPI002904B272|nr:ATPase, T2SS/T4P/T4SS family [Peptoniphilus rhinitidis]MDU1043861.1 ATPase, T2SS/T4P/T4SS family [Peptoniphilus rhinitidis]